MVYYDDNSIWYITLFYKHKCALTHNFGEKLKYLRSQEYRLQFLTIQEKYNIKVPSA